MTVSRRRILAGMSAAFGFGFPPVAAAASGDLDQVVAANVRKLAAGRDITLKVLLPNGSNANLAPVISAFTANTGVRVESFETQVDDINTELSLHVFSHTSKYDIALPATFGVPDLASSDAILPITNFAKRYEPPGFRDGFLYAIGDGFDEDIFGFQADGDAYVMFYNKAFLENPADAARYADTFGKALTQPTTWPELDQQMAFFNRPDQDQWGGLLFRSRGYLAWEWWVRFHAKGVWPFSPEMEPQIASDEGVEALEELIRATQSQNPQVFELGLFENWERYSQGDIYCNIGWGGTQKFLNGAHSKMRGNMVYGPMPGGVVDGGLLETPYFNWGWSYVLPRNTRHPEIAYLFSLFASTPRMSTLAVRQQDGFFDPHKPEHYNDPGIRDAYSPEFLSVHRASLEAAIPDLYLQGQGEYFRVLNEGLHKALTGQEKPRRALQRIAKRWQVTTESYGRDSQIRRWAKLKEKYPRIARDRLKNLV